MTNAAVFLLSNRRFLKANNADLIVLSLHNGKWLKKLVNRYFLLLSLSLAIK